MTPTEGPPIDYRDTRVLVLGAAGFVGDPLVRQLVAAGAEVHAATRTPVTPARPIGLHLVDAADPDAVRHLVTRVEPDLVFNAVGYGVDPEERRTPDPALAARLNTELPVTLAAAIASVPGRPGWTGQRLVHIGSVLEYGPIGGHLTETSTARPVGWYATTKCAGTMGLARSATAAGVRALTARVPQLYGPGEHPSRLLPTLFRAARTGETLVLTRGTQQKDFLHVSDAATGLLRLGQTRAGKGEIVNLATGHLSTVHRFTMLAAHLLRIPAERLRFENPVPEGELEHEPIDIARLEALTGWRPRTTLEEGLGRTVAADGIAFFTR